MFPFERKNRTYHECKSSNDKDAIGNSRIIYWCFVEDNILSGPYAGNNNWGVCDDNCPREKAPND